MEAGQGVLGNKGYKVGSVELKLTVVLGNFYHYLTVCPGKVGGGPGVALGAVGGVKVVGYRSVITKHTAAHLGLNRERRVQLRASYSLQCGSGYGRLYADAVVIIVGERGLSVARCYN